MDFSKTLIHCSSLGKLFTEPKSKAAKEAGELSETAKKHLIEVYVSAKYGRHKEIETIAMKKGTFVEEDSITLLSKFDKEFYVKNEQTLQNDCIIGTPDILHQMSPYKKKVLDTKSSQDLFTFLANLTEEMKADYYWQLQGYMSLSDAYEGEIAYCLIDTPDFLIESELRKKMYKLPADQEQFVKDELYKQLTYSDLHYTQRVIKQHTLRNQADIDRIPFVVEKAREYLNELDKIARSIAA